MAKVSITRELGLLSGLVLLGATVIGAGVITFRPLVEAHLERHGEVAALHFADHYRARPEELARALAGAAAAPLPLPSRRPGEPYAIVRYELFDASGALRHASGADEVGGARTGERIVVPDGPVTKLIQHGSGEPTATYAATTFPLRHDGELTGALRAFVDLTDDAQNLRRVFGWLAGLVSLLVLVAVGVPTAIIGLRIRDQLRAEAEIRFLSQHDKLTGLLDPETFKERLAAMLAKPEAECGQTAVVSIDVDKFDELSVEVGQQTADLVLQRLAQRLLSNVREFDLVARRGGDKFTVALGGLRSAETLTATVRRLHSAITRPYAIDGMEITCTACIGVASTPNGGNSALALMRSADLALRGGRDDERNTIRYFQQGMDTAYEQRRSRTSDLRRAVMAGDFELHYQPLICLQTEALCGHEALARWHHPMHGTISPAYFIPIAEETELIVPLGEWIVWRACEDAVEWPQPRQVAVNLSPIQFKRTSVSSLISRALDDTGLAPSELEVEITESLLMSDTETVLKELARLHDLGVGIAMDDFGTGYSSLSYLSRFPFNKIKIDRSFIGNIENDKSVQAIVGCIVALGRSLNVTITVEGVETPQQAALLKKLGCHQAQGYYYGRPAPADEAKRRLAKGARLGSRRQLSSHVA